MYDTSKLYVALDERDVAFLVSYHMYVCITSHNLAENTYVHAHHVS